MRSFSLQAGDRVAGPEDDPVEHRDRGRGRGIQALGTSSILRLSRIARDEARDRDARARVGLDV